MGHLDTTCFADDSVFCACPIVEHVKLAERTYRVRIDAPQIAERIVPGQFVMLRLPHANDPLLARPFALYDIMPDDAGSPRYVDIVYLVLGKMTTQLAEYTTGQTLEAWGPLGNGFPLIDREHLIMVAGGIGQTPFLAVGREFLGAEVNRANGRPTASRQATLCYGVRTANLAAGCDDFRATGIDLRLASDDGSTGHHGLVTDLLSQAIDETNGKSRVVFCCGPEPMMHAVAKICDAAQVECYVSLETPMACGLGICFSCVAPVQDGNGDWDYRRTCVDGPVFEAQQIAWEQMLAD